jgi:hypothetical protein
MLKFESLATVGDRIRAYDFRGDLDHYIEGTVMSVGEIVGPRGPLYYTGYTIDIDVDTLGGRAGDTGYVPFETTFDYDRRIELVTV